MQRWILKKKIMPFKSAQSAMRSNNGVLSLVFSSSIEICVIILFNIYSFVKISHDRIQANPAEADFTSSGWYAVRKAKSGWVKEFLVVRTVRYLSKPLKYRYQ